MDDYFIVIMDYGFIESFDNLKEADDCAKRLKKGSPDDSVIVYKAFMNYAATTEVTVRSEHVSVPDQITHTRGGSFVTNMSEQDYV